MLNLFLYGISIMYTPGPVNLLGLNIGFRNRVKQSLGFFIAVACSMLILFLVFGYTGEKVMKKSYLIYTSFIGCLYILYLAFKLFKAKVNVEQEENVRDFSFRDGFMMQLLNPKAALATLPIATIMYPDNDIVGFKIVVMSVVLSILAFGAPLSYSILGTYFSHLIKNEKFFDLFNKVMALLLIYVAFTIFKDHVFLVIKGVHAY